MFHRHNILIGTGAAALVVAAADWSEVRSLGSMEEYAAAMAALRAPLPPSPDAADLIRFATLIATGNSAQIADPAFITELKRWMRFSPRRALATGDGLFSATTGNPTLPDWLCPTMVDWVLKAARDNRSTAAKIASSAGLAVFVGAKDDPGHWVQTGRACQRFALQATAMKLKHAFLNQPVEVTSLRPDLAALIGMPGRTPARLDTQMTSVTTMLDLGLIVPLCLIAAGRIWRGQIVGHVIAFPLLGCRVGLFSWIILATLFQVVAGIAFTKAEVIGPMVGFSTLGLGSAWFLYAGWRGAAPLELAKTSPAIRVT